MVAGISSKVLVTNNNNALAKLYDVLFNKEQKKDSSNFSELSKQVLLNKGFTNEGIKLLIDNTNILGESIIESVMAVIALLNNHIQDGGVVSYRLLKKYVNDVAPDVTETKKEIVRDIITKGTKLGDDIQRDYYSQIPDGLIEEMRKWYCQ